MKPQGNGQPIPFTVSMAVMVRAQLKALHREAIAAGRGQQVVAAFRQMVTRLQQDPLRFGEPLYRLPALRLLVCQAVIHPLVINFAVHEEQPLVFIRGFALLPENP